MALALRPCPSHCGCVDPQCPAPVLKKFGIADLNSNQAIIIALLGGIAVTCLMNLHQLKEVLPAFNAGANGSLAAIMNTSCAVGFGAILKIVPGFEVLKNAMLNMPAPFSFPRQLPLTFCLVPRARARAACRSRLKRLAPYILPRRRRSV